MKKFLFLAIVALGCSTLKKSTTTSVNSTQPPANPSSLIVDGKLFGSVYQQKAAEYKALCIQAYNLAMMRLDQAIARERGKPLAIITDLDETVLDNSQYAIHRALQGKAYFVKPSNISALNIIVRKILDFVN